MAQCWGILLAVRVVLYRNVGTLFLLRYASLVGVIPRQFARPWWLGLAAGRRPRTVYGTYTALVYITPILGGCQPTVI
ncbi:MAG: hypothetical protein R2795_17850 [Saprospiraceae bacterium]